MALWRSQSIQVVWFLTGSDVSVGQLYQSLFAVEPDRLERNRTPNASNPFMGVASGLVEGLTATLQHQLGRVDLFLAPDPDTQDADIAPTLDSEVVIDWLHDRLSGAAAQFPAAVRVAIVCNFLKTAGNLEEARAEIAELVNLDKRLQSYSDFMFQINRRMNGPQTGVEFNRLLRWASVVFQNVVLNFPSHVSLFTPPAAGVEHHASSFVVDLNTVLGSKAFESQQQVSIFEDMLTELKRLGSDRTPSALLSE